MIGNLVVPGLMAVVGALIMALTSNGNAKEVGKAMLWAGLFALAFFLSGHRVAL
jgi:hypothetical protein